MEINAQGNEVIRDFNHTDRYSFDMGQCSTKNGFAQIDTSQDAWYYGNWANPFKLLIVTYAEGNIIIVKCKSKETFKAEIEAMKKWNDESGHGFYGIDPGFNKPLKTEFINVGLETFLH